MNPTEKNGVYGENLPVEKTQEGNSEAFEKIRQDAAHEKETEGGMGRKETPRDGDSQGEWHQEDKVGADRPNI